MGGVKRNGLVGCRPVQSLCPSRGRGGRSKLMEWCAQEAGGSMPTNQSSRACLHHFLIPLPPPQPQPLVTPLKEAK